MNLDKMLKMIFPLFSFVGISMLIGSIYSFSHTNNIIKTYQKTQGEVTELVSKRSFSKKSQSIMYYPVVKFYLNKTPFEFTGSTGSTPPSYKIRDSVEVLYNPKDPRQAKINSFVSLWILPLVFAFLGMVFCIVSYCILIFSIRPQEINKNLRDCM